MSREKMFVGRSTCESETADWTSKNHRSPLQTQVVVGVDVSVPGHCGCGCFGSSGGALADARTILKWLGPSLCSVWIMFQH